MFSYFKNAIHIFVQQDETFLDDQDVVEIEDLAEKRFQILKDWDEFLKERKEAKKDSIFDPDDFKALPGNKRFNPFRPLSHIEAGKDRYKSFKIVDRVPFESKQNIPPNQPSRGKNFCFVKEEPKKIVTEEAKKPEEEVKKAGAKKNKKSTAISGIFYINQSSLTFTNLAFSKNSRNYSGQQEKGPSRNQKKTTVDFRALDKKHDSVTFSGYCLRKSIKANGNQMIFEKISSAVKELNLIKRLAQKANLFLIEKAAADRCLNLLHPSTHGSTKDNGGQQYWYQLLSIIRNEKLRTGSKTLSVFKKYLVDLKPFFLNQIGKYFA